MNDENDFTDLENKLRNALTREKKSGLHPEQLNALHKAIEAGSSRMAAPKKRPWWQLSLAGSVLATAMIAFIVVNRFPGSEQPQTETAESWSNVTAPQSEVDEKARTPAGPMESLESEGLGRSASVQIAKKTTKNESAATAKPKKQAGPNVKSGLQMADGSADFKKGRRSKAPKKIAPPAASATPSLGKSQWKTPGGSSNNQPESKTSADSSDDAPIAAPPKPAAPLAEHAKAKRKGAEKSLKADNEEVTLTEKESEIGAAGGNSGKNNFGSGAGLGGASLSGQQSNTSRPNVRIVEIKTDGNSQVAKSVIHANLNQLRWCYESFEQQYPASTGPRAGSMRITWTINKSGKVDNLKIPSESANLFGLRACVLRRIVIWKFPAEAAAEISVTADFGPT